MLLQAMVEIPWLAPVLWAVLYISDYTLTLVGAHLYRNGADKHYRFGGSYELTPYFQSEIDHMRRISPRFLIMLAVTVLFVIAFRPLLLESSNSANAIEAYQCCLGTLFLPEMVVHLRHFQNILTFTYLRRSIGVSGQMRVAKGITYRLSAGEMITFSLLFLLFFLLTGRWFFLGGTATCLITAMKHWRLGVKAGLAMPPVQEETPAGVAE